MAIPPLTCSTKLGQPYTRPTDAEAQIEEALGYLPDDWGRTSACNWINWRLETFVYLARLRARANNQAVFGRLVEEFLKRTGRVIRKYSKGFSLTDSEEIEAAVIKQVVERLLANTPSRASEYLEVSAYTVIKQLTLREVEKRKHDPRPNALLSLSEDEGDGVLALANISDINSDPLALLLATEEGQRFFRDLLEAVTDPRHREAFILHKLRGWPIKPDDPAKPSLSKRFGMSARQIHNWIATASRQMKTALGEE